MGSTERRRAGAAGDSGAARRTVRASRRAHALTRWLSFPCCTAFTASLYLIAPLKLPSASTTGRPFFLIRSISANASSIVSSSSTVLTVVVITSSAVTCSGI